MGMYLPSSRPMISPITVPTIASPKEENFTPGRRAAIAAPKVAQRMAPLCCAAKGCSYGCNQRSPVEPSRPH